MTGRQLGSGFSLFSHPSGFQPVTALSFGLKAKLLFPSTLLFFIIIPSIFRKVKRDCILINRSKFGIIYFNDFLYIIYGVSFMSENAMSAAVTPVAKVSARCCREPLGIISSAVTVLSGALALLLDFEVGVFVFSAAVLGLSAYICSFKAAKRPTEALCLPSVLLAAAWGVLSLVGFIATTFFVEELSFLPDVLESVTVGGFRIFSLEKLSAAAYLLPIILLFSGRFLSALSLFKATKRNLPKRSGQIVSAVIFLISFISAVGASVLLFGAIPTELLPFETETVGQSYPQAAVVLLIAVSAGTEAARAFKIHFKMRKIEDAFFKETKI